jgi:hypothetical protein
MSDEDLRKQQLAVVVDNEKHRAHEFEEEKKRIMQERSLAEEQKKKLLDELSLKVEAENKQREQQSLLLARLKNMEKNMLRGTEMLEQAAQHEAMLKKAQVNKKIKNLF